VSKLDLQPPFRGRGALAEDLEDQARTVDHLRADLVFQVLLLDRRQRCVDDEQPRPLLLCEITDLLDLALAEQGCRPDRPDPKGLARDDVDADRFGQPLRFLDARVGRAPRSFARKLGYCDNRAFAARDLDRSVAIESVQGFSSASVGSCSAPKVSGCAG
jgi:hypothetical protein